MCGIVGLFAKTNRVQAELGLHLAAMLASMSERGPDSAGFAVYAPGQSGHFKLTLRPPPGSDPEALLARLGIPDSHIVPRGSHAVLSVPDHARAAATAALARAAPDTVVVGSGAHMELYKEVGAPADVARGFGLAGMTGSHGIGHTRMATESAVTTDGAHPFSTGPDQCLVHNGSLSNHNALRRELRRRGFGFATENDTEVAAVYLTARMRQGASLGEALRGALDDLDGFYTFVVGTGSGFGVLRDPIACKPAVLAETDDYVAFGTEYRALAALPGIATARVWEPEPATVYFWDRA
jgi:methylamine---glutamate N-methyltransferase subunit A